MAEMQMLGLIKKQRDKKKKKDGPTRIDPQVATAEARRKAGIGVQGRVGMGPLGVGGEPNLGKRTLLGGA